MQNLFIYLLRKLKNKQFLFLFQFIWLFSVTQLSPVTYGDYEYPYGAIVFGWMLGLASIVPVPVCAIIAILREKGSFVQVSCHRHILFYQDF